VVGVDQAWAAIRENWTLDRTVVGVAEHLPFRAAAFDLVFSDWVVEHLAAPEAVASEIFRVLKSDGHFILRTGNVHHYSYALAARTPHWFHLMAANWLRGLPSESEDPYPTYYRMNTMRGVRRCLTRAGFVEEEISMVEAEPSYLMFSVPSFLLGVAYERIVNSVRFLSGLRACIFASFRKPDFARVQ
jgi:SAM-dependent methyltransferase